MTDFELWRIIHKYDRIIRKERKEKMKAVREAFKNSHFLAMKDAFPSDFKGAGICGSYTLEELFGTEDLRLIRDALHRSFKRCQLTLIEDTSSAYASPNEELIEKRWHIAYGKVWLGGRPFCHNYPRVGYLVGKD